MDYSTARRRGNKKILLWSSSAENIKWFLNLIQRCFHKETLRQLREKVRMLILMRKLPVYIDSNSKPDTQQQRSLSRWFTEKRSISIMIGAKAIAAISGRDFVTPDDVKMVVYPTLRHRILLTPEKEMEAKLWWHHQNNIGKSWGSR